jgi:hypothetical protein
MLPKKHFLSVPFLAGLFLLSVCIGIEGLTPKMTVASDPLQTDATNNSTAANQPRTSSVLERFRTFSGQRTPKALSALFKPTVSPQYSQQPEIALSDGATVVSIKLLLPVQDGPVPNFALSGARMLSCSKNQKGEWLLEALPETETVKAELVVSSDTALLEFPLVVAPPLSSEFDLSEQGFINFLAGKDRTAPSQKDLNGDGRTDYRDDYIYTANYLVRKNSAPGASESDKQSPATQDTGIAVEVDKRQEPGRETIQAPQPVEQPPNPNPHSLSNRNERARQMKQMLQN